MIRQLACAATIGALMSAPAAAQTTSRLYVSVAGGAQAPAKTVTDTFIHTVNVEDAITEARYPSKAGGLIDVGGGVRVWRQLWGGVHVTHSSAGGSAQVSSQVPHPLFDNRHRSVSGEASGVDRKETAIHGQLSWLIERGRWQFRFGGGPTHFRLELPVITGVTVDETFPYDTATFRSATTTTSRKSALGFNFGADAGRMFSPRFGAGVTLRYARGEVDLSAGGDHVLSLDAGGAQVAGGLRILF